MIIVLEVKQVARNNRQWAQPMLFLVPVISLVVALFLWIALENLEKRHIHTVTEKRLHSLLVHFNTSFERKVNALQRMAKRWEVSEGQLSRKQWERDASNLHQHFETLQAIMLVGQDYRVRFVTPLGGNEVSYNMDLSSKPLLSEAMQQSLKFQKAYASVVFDLPQGGEGFLVYLPLQLEGEFAGFVAGVFKLNVLLNAYMKPVEGEGYMTRIVNVGEGHIFHESAEYYHDDFVSSGKVFMLNNEWHVYLSASEALMGSLSSVLPQVFLCVGIVTSALLFALLFALRLLDKKAHELRQQSFLREQSLKQVEAISTRLESILNSVSEGIYGLNQQGELTFMNQAAHDMTGYSHEDFQQSSLHDLIQHTDIHGLAYPAEESHIKHVLLSHEAVRMKDEIFWRKEGDSFPVEYSATPILSKDRQLQGLVLVFRDMTRQRQSEAELSEYMHALELSNKELEQFAYIASHDLQEPLRTINSYVQLLSSKYQGQFDERAERWFEFIIDGSKRMKELIQGLLTYSRLQTEQTEHALVDLGKTINYVLQDLKPMLHDHEASVEVGELPKVMGEAVQLRQLLQNLVSNAVKYCPTDRKPRITITAERQDLYWRIAVKDNGIGIEERFYQRIFVIFQRLHGIGEYAGTGIGLALCQRIVERHGGSIEVDSQLGEGSTFLVSLPLVEAMTS